MFEAQEAAAIATREMLWPVWADRTSRRCAGCAKAHPGAVKKQGKKECEGQKCAGQLREASLGMLVEGKRRWCSACAPRGAVQRARSKQRQRPPTASGVD